MDAVQQVLQKFDTGDGCLQREDCHHILTGICNFSASDADRVISDLALVDVGRIKIADFIHWVDKDRDQDVYKPSVRADLVGVYMGYFREYFHSLELFSDGSADRKIVISDDCYQDTTTWNGSWELVGDEVVVRPNETELKMKQKSFRVLAPFVLAELEDDGSICKWETGSPSIFLLKEGAPRSFDNRDAALTAVLKDSHIFEYAREQFANDKEIALAAVTHCGSMLNLVSKELKCDCDVATLAVTNWPQALKWVQSETISSLPRDVIMEAVRKDRFCFEHLPEQMRYDFKIALEVVSRHGSNLQYTSPELKDTFEIVNAAILNDPCAYMYASDSMRENKDWLLKAVQVEGRILGYAPLELRADREVVMLAAKENAKALVYASDELRLDEEIRRSARTRKGFTSWGGWEAIDQKKDPLYGCSI